MSLFNNEKGIRKPYSYLSHYFVGSPKYDLDEFRKCYSFKLIRNTKRRRFVFLLVLANKIDGISNQVEKIFAFAYVTT